MKNFKYLFSVAAVAALFGCSSMEIDEAEALQENFPADFSVEEYMSIHPRLRYLQIKDYIQGDKDNRVVGYNEKFTAAIKRASAVQKADEELLAKIAAATEAGDAALVAELTRQEAVYADSLKLIDSLSAMVASDSAAFDADTAMLHFFYSYPYIGAALGFTEEDWADSWGGGVKYDSTAIVKIDTTVLVAEGESLEVSPKKIYLKAEDEASKITYDADGTTIVKVNGYNEATFETPFELEVAEGITFNKSGTKVNRDTTGFTVDTVATAGEIDAESMKLLRLFNFYDTVDDSTAIKSVPLDEFAISYQYVQFGKLQGWAYRRCTEAEKSNPAITESFPATKLYCDDNGIAREIN